MFLLANDSPKGGFWGWTLTLTTKDNVTSIYFAYYDVNLMLMYAGAVTLIIFPLGSLVELPNICVYETYLTAYFHMPIIAIRLLGGSSYFFHLKSGKNC